MNERKKNTQKDEQEIIGQRILKLRESRNEREQDLGNSYL